MAGKRFNTLSSFQVHRARPQPICSGTSSGRSTSYRNTNSLHLRVAIGKLHLQRQNIDAHKIRTRAIKRNERGYLERQALLVAVTFAFLTVTLPFSGGDVSWIEGSGPDVQSGRTLTYTPTRISVLGSPLATRLTLCS